MKNRLKELRNVLGLRQRQIAERLHVPVSSVGAWEIGKAPIPFPRIYQICKEYGVSQKWLETGEGEMFEPGQRPKTARESLQEAALRMFREMPDDSQIAVMEVLERHFGHLVPKNWEEIYTDD